MEILIKFENTIVPNKKQMSAKVDGQEIDFITLHNVTHVKQPENGMMTMYHIKKLEEIYEILKKF